MSLWVIREKFIMGKFRELYYEDFEVGDKVETMCRTLTEADIINFTGFSGDFNPLHIDEEYARNAGYSGRIAQGLCVASLASGLKGDIDNMAVIAYLKITINFRAPAYIGDRIKIEANVVEKRPTSKAGRGVITFGYKVLNQKNEVLQDGEQVYLVPMRSTK